MSHRIALALCFGVGIIGVAFAAPPSLVVGGTPPRSAAPGVLVGTVLSTGQALLWDESSEQYVLLRVGGTFHGHQVVCVGAEHVTLERAGVRRALPLSRAPVRIAVGAGPRGAPPILAGSEEVARTTLGGESLGPEGTTLPLSLSSGNPAAGPMVGATSPADGAPQGPTPTLAPDGSLRPPWGGPPGDAPVPMTSPPQPRWEGALPPAAVARGRGGAPRSAAPPAPPGGPRPAPSDAKGAAPPAPRSSPQGSLSTPSSVPPRSSVPAVPPSAPPPSGPAPAVAPPPVAPPAGPPAAPPIAPPPVTPGSGASVPPTGSLPPSPPSDPVNTYRVARAEVERVLSDFPELAKQVDVTAVPGGGLRLTVLRRGTLLDRLGLRQGDILRRVDDLPTGSPEEVLVAYARVRAARRLRVEIQRGRRSLVLTYLIDG